MQLQRLALHIPAGRKFTPHNPQLSHCPAILIHNLHPHATNPENLASSQHFYSFYCKTELTQW